MRSLCGKWVVSGLLFLVGCGGGQRMRQRPVTSAERQPTTASQASSSGTARPQSVPTVVPPIVMTDTQPTTPKSYAAAAPQKPKLPSVSEDELKQCEEALPPLESCKPQKPATEGQTQAQDEVRLCVAKYMASVHACLCKAGSKKNCQFADDQKREIGKMTPSS